jgi:DNA invertase Pin-like site-specific DNA recombinase
MGQDPEVQLRELREYVQRRGWILDPAYVFVDHGVSGSKDKRPALNRLMDAARKRKIEVVVVWKFDRFARSVRHLVTALEEFRGLGVSFVSLTESIDTSTPLGAMVFHVIAAMAEFERELTRERIHAGLRKARAAGKRLGRPPTDVNVEAAQQRLDSGRSLRSVAKELRVSRRTLGRALAESERAPGSRAS